MTLKSSGAEFHSPSSPDSVGEVLATAVMSAAKGNSHTAAPAAAILWPDKDGHWQPALHVLRKLLPSLCVLGPYEYEQRSGPPSG